MEEAQKKKNNRCLSLKKKGDRNEENRRSIVDVAICYKKYGKNVKLVGCEECDCWYHRRCLL